MSSPARRIINEVRKNPISDSIAPFLDYTEDRERTRGRITQDLAQAVDKAFYLLGKDGVTCKEWCENNDVNYQYARYLRSGISKTITFQAVEIFNKLDIPWLEYVACKHIFIKSSDPGIWQCKYCGEKRESS